MHQLGGLVSQHLAELLIDEGDPALRIGLDDTGCGLADDIFEPRAGLVEFELGQLARGDVADHAEDLRRRAIHRRLRLAEKIGPAQCTIGAKQPAGEVKSRALAKRRGHRGGERRTVVGMDHLAQEAAGRHGAIGRRNAENLARASVAPNDLVGGAIPAPQSQSGSLGGHTGALLRAAKFRLHPFLFSQHLLLLVDDLAQPELAPDLVRQRLERERFQLGQAVRARRGIENAQRSQGKAVVRLQYFAGIKAQARSAGDQRIAVEARIFPCIGHHHPFALQQREFADGVVERHLAHTQPDFGFEPLAPGVDQVHRNDRRIEKLPGQANDIVERLLRRGIENGVISKRGQSLLFCPGRTRNGVCHGGLP